MSIFIKTWVLLLTLLALAPSCLAEIRDGNPTGPLRVLFVGNSYLYYNDSLHNHVERLAAELHPDLADDLQFKSATIGGARLHQHNLDWLLDHEQLGMKQPFQAVIMQDHSTATLTEKHLAKFMQTTKSHAGRVRAAGAEPLLYMTHAYMPPHAKAREGMIDDIAAGYIAAGKRADARVIPVGLAFDLSYSRKPDLLLHEHFDGTHPNLLGTYLAACVVYLSLFGGSLEGLTYNYFGDLSDADISWLQGIATETVQQFRSGKPGRGK